MSKRYAIFGAGQSAQAARRLANHEGLEVVLIDEAGGGDRATFDANQLNEFDAFVFSPGFAAKHPWRVLAESSGLPCMSEIAFAARYWRGQIIGITGTNGKTTLTELIDQALRLTGHVSVAAGNIGFPFSDAVLSEANRSGAYVVLEISSFQAELSDGLLLDALLWSNLAEDHLDRYGSMLHYYSAKAQLFNCLKEDGVCVIGSQVVDWMERVHQEFDACTVAFEDAELLMKLTPASIFRQFPYSENFSLAVELWWWLEQPFGKIIEAADVFERAPHRLGVVAEHDGVRYWDDSKATNFHATHAALESVTGPIVWIGGGRAKGGDLTAFAQDVAGCVCAAVVYGEVAERLAQDMKAVSLDLVKVEPSFSDAVLAAVELAKSIPNANVLLSPGFCSFDQFDSYAERGKSFTDLVLGLKNTGIAS